MAVSSAGWPPSTQGAGQPGLRGREQSPCAPVAVFGRGARASLAFSSHFKPTNGKVSSAAKDTQVLALLVWREASFFFSYL